MALRWRDVDLASGTLHVERAYDPRAREYVEPKSRAGRRRVPIAGALRDALDDHRAKLGTVDPDALALGDGAAPFSYATAVERARAAWAKAKDRAACGEAHSGLGDDRRGREREGSE